MKNKSITYSLAILEAFKYLLDNYKETFVIGQGLWSPWYVGNTMKNLDKKYGKNRIIDTPVSESAVTGAAIGASIMGMKPIVIHPRMDFMLYAIDSIVNQAANWSHMFGGQANAPVTIRSIINRGGEQGQQHSQALHAWFAHIPGLRVVTPSTVADARDLLISSVLCADPVIFIDDRWLYDQKSTIPPVKEFDLKSVKPKTLMNGDDLTVVASGYSTFLATKAANLLKKQNIKVDVIDLRVIKPLCINDILLSVKKTKKLLVIDHGWKFSGYSAEIISSIVENIGPNSLAAPPVRIALPNAPAPSSSFLEKGYYTSVEDIIKVIIKILYK